jgi:hypothetical protein
MSIKEKWSSSIDGRISDHLHKGPREQRVSDDLVSKHTRAKYELKSSL